MVEITGIPHHKERNCIQLVSKLAKLIEITNFNKNQIDLAHRTFTNSHPLPQKNDRINFYNQRKKLRKLRSDLFKIARKLAVILIVKIMRTTYSRMKD